MAKVLVVDDRAENRALIVTLIQHRGHQALEAADGAEALALVQAEHPELVISDILMPTMDGYEFVRRLRADPTLAATDVIFYTAHYHEREARNLARACDVSRVLIKPCEPEDILSAIDQALAHAPAPVPPPTDTQDFDREHLRLVSDKLLKNVADLEAANLRMAALTDLNLQLASEQDPRVLLEKVCRGARNLIGAKYAVLCVKGKDGEAPIFYTSGIEPSLANGLERLDADHGSLGEVMAERRSRRKVHPEGAATDAGLPAGYPPVRASLTAPIVSLAKAYGWIVLADKLGAEESTEFSAEDEQLLSILTAQAGRVYENGSLYKEVRRNAEVLQESELRFRQLTENIAEVFWMTDPAKNAMLYISPAYESIWGRSCKDLYASPRTWLDAIHLDDRERVLQVAISKQIRGDYDEEYRIVRPDGSVRWIGDRAFPILNQEGHAYRIAGVAQDITERKQAADDLRESQRRFSDLLDNVELLSLMLDREARITYCNNYLLRLTEWRREEVIGRDWFELFIPADTRDEVKPVFADLITNIPEAWHNDNEILTRSGERRLIRWNNSVLRSAEGEVIGTASIGEDVTERKQAEVRIKRMNRVYAVLSGINTLIVRVRDRDELFREACRLAVDAGEFVTADIVLFDADSKQASLAASSSTDVRYLEQQRAYLATVSTMDSQASHGKGLQFGDALVFNDRQNVPASLQGTEIMASTRATCALPLVIAGRTIGVFVLRAHEVGFFDDEEMKLLRELAGDIAFAVDHIEKRERLDYLAYYDVLTGLANRRLFLERLAQYKRSATASGYKLGLILIDLERFKSINDSFGRPAGDMLLRKVAEWLAGNVGGADLLARLDADHFALIVLEVRGEEGLARLVEAKQKALLHHPFQFNDDSMVRVAARVGVSVFPDDGADAETLLLNAEAALKQAKARGDRFLFYSKNMTAAVAGKLTLENQLRLAVEREEFVLHYQPKISLASGKLTGAEALIRWNDPLTGLVPPGRFIPILEESGLIHDVGRWALRTAVAEYLRWCAAGLPAVRIAVNVSSPQLRSRRFIDDVREVVGVDPRAAGGLELEITESLIMEEVGRSIESLQALRALGINIAIDDFGTGFSSLAYLAKLPLDTLKIDITFVKGMLAGPEGLALVQTIISLGHSLKLKIVAEGVETEEQSRLLRLLNCDDMQGFLFSQAVPSDIFEGRFLVQPPANIRSWSLSGEITLPTTVAWKPGGVCDGPR